MNEIELIDKQALIDHLNTTMYRDVIEEIKNFPLKCIDDCFKEMRKDRKNEE